MHQPNQKIITVVNPESCYHQQKGKLLALLPEEKAEVFLMQEEIIVVLNLSDINLNQQIFKPQSRKDFYDYVQKVTTSRSDMVRTVNQLIKDEVIKFNPGYTPENLQSLLENLDLDKYQLVEEFRALRDQGKFDFTLTGFKPQPMNRPRKYNPNFKPKSSFRRN
jgi:hypothetical protein